MVKDYPDCPVRQYREPLSLEQSLYVSVGGMCEFLKKEGLTLTEQNYSLLGQRNATCLVNRHEKSASLGVARR
ncbi:MAG: hypothetical protein GDA48_23240 [Hormoscilla sp. GM102CHS1]|nr:hypothetical protein [Hormoscilla sp. GM102CHS1]